MTYFISYFLVFPLFITSIKNNKDLFLSNNNQLFIRSQDKKKSNLITKNGII